MEHCLKSDDNPDAIDEVNPQARGTSDSPDANMVDDPQAHGTSDSPDASMVDDPQANGTFDSLSATTVDNSQASETSSSMSNNTFCMLLLGFNNNHVKVKWPVVLTILHKWFRFDFSEMVAIKYEIEKSQTLTSKISMTIDAVRIILEKYVDQGKLFSISSAQVRYTFYLIDPPELVCNLEGAERQNGILQIAGSILPIMTESFPKVILITEDVEHISVHGRSSQYLKDLRELLVYESIKDLLNENYVFVAITHRSDRDSKVSFGDRISDWLDGLRDLLGFKPLVEWIPYEFESQNQNLFNGIKQLMMEKDDTNGSMILTKLQKASFNDQTFANATYWCPKHHDDDDDDVKLHESVQAYHNVISKCPKCYNDYYDLANDTFKKISEVGSRIFAHRHGQEILDDVSEHLCRNREAGKSFE